MVGFVQDKLQVLEEVRNSESGSISKCSVSILSVPWVSVRRVREWSFTGQIKKNIDANVFQIFASIFVHLFS